MIEESYNKVKTWHDAYVSKFSSENSEIQINIDLVKGHSLRVLENVDVIATSVNLEPSQLLLLRTAALLHDIGRFHQLITHETYVDNDDLNHMQFALDLIEEQGVLNHLEEEERALIMDCVKTHDLGVLPSKIQKTTIALVNLLRDADRIDVLRMVSDYYTHKKVHPNRFLDMELKDVPGVEKKIFKAIMAEKMARREDVLNLNDLKLYQMSWIFDFKYKRSFKMVSEKGYIKAIFETLPKNDEVIDMYRNIKIFMENQL